MTTTSYLEGFYLWDSEQQELHRAPTFVSGPGFELSADSDTDRLTGAGGWSWFESRTAAEAALIPAQ